MPALPDAPRNLIDVADWFLSVNDDLLEPDEEIEELDDATARAIIARNYRSGDCQAFAIALHDHLSLPIVALNGGFHVAVQCPDGQLMDYSGTHPLKVLAKRYGFKAPTLTSWTRAETLGHLCADEDDEATPWGHVALARFVLQAEDRWTMPAASLPEPTPAPQALNRRRPGR